MLIFVIVLIALFLIGLNFGLRNHNWSDTNTQHTEVVYEIFDRPVARTYPVLYWYATLHSLVLIGNALWIFIYKQPWKAITPQYQAMHDPHATVAFLQFQSEMDLLVYPVLLIAAYVFVVLSKNMKTIISFLKLFVSLDVLELLGEIAKPSYNLVIDFVLAAFTFSVLLSLIKKKTNFFESFPFIRNQKNRA